MVFRLFYARRYVVVEVEANYKILGFFFTKNHDFYLINNHPFIQNLNSFEFIIIVFLLILGKALIIKQARNPGTRFTWDTRALCVEISE